METLFLLRGLWTLWTNIGPLKFNLIHLSLYPVKERTTLVNHQMLKYLVYFKMSTVLYWLHFNNQGRCGYWTVQTTIKRINIIIIVIIINSYNEIVSKTYTEQRWEGIPIMVHFLIFISYYIHLQSLQTDLHRFP